MHVMISQQWMNDFYVDGLIIDFVTVVCVDVL
jgi:hypothetical protein